MICYVQFINSALFFSGDQSKEFVILYHPLSNLSIQLLETSLNCVQGQGAAEKALLGLGVVGCTEHGMMERTKHWWLEESYRLEIRVRNYKETLKSLWKIELKLILVQAFLKSMHCAFIIHICISMNCLKTSCIHPWGKETQSHATRFADMLWRPWERAPGLTCWAMARMRQYSASALGEEEGAATRTWQPSPLKLSVPLWKHPSRSW